MFILVIRIYFSGILIISFLTIPTWTDIIFWIFFKLKLSKNIFKRVIFEPLFKNSVTQIERANLIGGARMLSGALSARTIVTHRDVHLRNVPRDNTNSGNYIIIVLTNVFHFWWLERFWCHFGNLESRLKYWTHKIKVIR